MGVVEVDVSIETSKAARTFDGSMPSRQSEADLKPRLNAALAALLESHDYARDLNVSIWDFAIEISNLRRLKLTNNDLRWLIGRGFVDHAMEVTLTADAQRSFRQAVRPLFGKKACFVITAAGEMLAMKHCRSSGLGAGTNGNPIAQQSCITVASAPEPLTPKWDRDRQELRLGLIVVKRFKVPAANQETILAVFEEESWPTRIDDPLSSHPEQSPKRRLQETIKSLNRNQKRPLIRFLGDGSGEGVRWEFCQQNSTDNTVDALQA